MGSDRLVEVKLPAESIDQYQRPAFIVRNDAGIEVCENRLSCSYSSLLSYYHSTAWISCSIFLSADLVAKGAVLKKGQRLRSRFCKFTKGRF
jgi:hypothetical protein